MHTIIEWEAARSGAGITVHMTDGDGESRKQFVKKIEARDGTVTAIGGDGARFPLTVGRETSPEVAALAGELCAVTGEQLKDSDHDALAVKIRSLAASALSQHA